MEPKVRAAEIAEGQQHARTRFFVEVEPPSFLDFSLLRTLHKLYT